MAHLEERLRTKGCVECDNIWKARETLHRMVSTDKHRVDAAKSREADLRGQFESFRKGQLNGLGAHGQRHNALERENQDLRDTKSCQGMRIAQNGRARRNAFCCSKQSTSNLVVQETAFEYC